MNSKRSALVALLLLGACGVTRPVSPPPGAELDCWELTAAPLKPRVVCQVVTGKR